MMYRTVLLSLCMLFNVTCFAGNPCNKEIEVKLRVDEQQLHQAQAWLDANAQFCGTLHHKEYYLNNPKDSFLFDAPEGFKDALDYLRVRFTQGGDSCCFKKFHVDPVEQRPLYCDEYELGIEDGTKMLAFMHALGYAEQTLMEKTRSTYLYDCFEIVIDDVKNLGFFMEVELKADFATAQEGLEHIYDFLQSIGITTFELITRGYITLLWNPGFDFGQEVDLQKFAKKRVDVKNK